MTVEPASGIDTIQEVSRRFPDSPHGHLEDLRDDPIDLLHRVRDECGDVGRFKLGPRDVVLVSGAEVNEQFFRAPDSTLDQAAAYPFMTPIFGKGVVFDASPEERDFSAINQGLFRGLKGSCMYCNHCLPCPSGLDIARITALTDAAQQGLTETLRAEYAAVSPGASDCIRCGSCMERCPFKVDVVANMARAAEQFGR